MKKLLCVFLTLLMVLSSIVNMSAVEADRDYDGASVLMNTDAHIVTSGSTFNIEAVFDEEQASNTAKLSFTFDGNLFVASHYTAPSGASVIEIHEGEGFITVLLMIRDYRAKDLGSIQLQAKENVLLRREKQTVALDVEYVLRDEENEKSILTSHSDVRITSAPLLGDTNDDGVVDLIDLSNIIDWFGFDNTHEDWEDTCVYVDFNNDGMISIYDISLLAQLIGTSEIKISLEQLKDLIDYVYTWPRHYTEDSWTNLQNALDAAEIIAGDAQATQQQINGAIRLLQTALDNLIPLTDKVVSIGVFEPQSGDNGVGGKQEILGMKYANILTPTIEIGGETYLVELVYGDNQSDIAKAPAAAQTLVSAGCSVVLGSYGSGVSIAGSDVFGDADIPVIGVTCTNPAVTEGNSHYFRICYLDPFQGTVLANFAKDEFTATKAYVLAKQGDDYSASLCHSFMEAFGAENCVYETFPEGTTDFSPYIASAKAAGAKVFFSPVSTEAAALIIDQAATQDLGIPILAGDTWDSNVILNAARGKNIQVYVTTFYHEGGDPEFDAGFKALLGTSRYFLANNGGDDRVSSLSAMGYDAYYTALEALKAAGTTDSKKVMEAIWNVTYEGVTGSIAFNIVGDAVRDSSFVKKCNTQTGEWEFVKLQDVK